ncbi:MAG: histidine phosphatase family protein [Proteobacteria bacterium]|nr:histidine phosphatase family protein [Pseudomonadota bacterium]
MPTLYVVRHGHVHPSPSDPEDPELSARGHSQAASVAQELHGRLPSKLPIVTSPMRRCRETAAPLCAMWGVEPLVEPRVAEVPGPPPELLPRAEWIRQSLLVEWPEFIELGQSLVNGYDSMLTHWRAGVLEAVLACPHDAVIFSHFVPLNVLTGQATGSNRVACFLPDHTSVTVFETSGQGIRLLERGREKSAHPVTVHPGR